MVIVTVSRVGVQTPFEILHSSSNVPFSKPVTSVVGEVGSVIIPVPLMTFHIPVPINGVLAVKYVDV